MILQFITSYIAPFVLIVSLIAAMIAGRVTSRHPAAVENIAGIVVVIALVVARIVFVLQYLPAYREHWPGIFDIRDLGFDHTAGAVAGAIALAWFLVRRRNLRVPLLVSAGVGLTIWTATTAAVEVATADRRIPDVVVYDAAGTPRQVSPGNGKPLVVNLWATWCPPCRAEMPMLAAMQQQRRGIEIVFVNQAEAPDQVLDFFEEAGMQIRNSLFDPQLSFARAVHATAYPTTLFYDGTGKLVGMHRGGFSRATFEDALARYFPAPGPRATSSQTPTVRNVTAQTASDAPSARGH